MSISIKKVSAGVSKNVRFAALGVVALDVLQIWVVWDTQKISSKRVIRSRRFFLANLDNYLLSAFLFRSSPIRLRAIEKYRKCFDLALSRSEGDKLDKLRAVNNNAEILQRDWEIWLKEKKASQVCQVNHDTCLSIQQDFTSTMINIADAKKSDNNKENEFDIEEDSNCVGKHQLEEVNVKELNNEGASFHHLQKRRDQENIN
ncbi:hypothetical protein F8M41_026291 [Gigaspora margarita]|uniref:Uncharacterized protein n=1 Tax=Gigaspora margarita TaxID=4874 RepID=A0A8H4A950_GIGMA|nr:hypothetical protein F8M41_026291 [Gigaspora margarita]